MKQVNQTLSATNDSQSNTIIGVAYRVGRTKSDTPGETDKSGTTDSNAPIASELVQEAVVIGWYRGLGVRRQSVGSLLLAVPSDEGLKFAGRVATGFTDAELVEIRKRLDKISRQTTPVDDVPRPYRRGAHWVTAKYTARIKYSSLTRNGYLKHPVWRGWVD